MKSPPKGTETNKRAQTWKPQRYPGSLPTSYNDCVNAAKLYPSFYSIHATKGDAQQALGPTFLKQNVERTIERWYCIRCGGKGKIMQFTLLQHTGPYAGKSCTKHVLERTILCTHRIPSWMDSLLKRNDDPSEKTRDVGLPPKVKEKCDEIQTQYMGITPVMCFHMVHRALVDQDECFRDPSARSILRTKIMRYRSVTRRRRDQKLNLKTSQDIMLYRQNLDLLSKLPKWWIPEPILSEPHLYEIGKRLSMEGIIGLKPADSPNDANIPSHLFTLNVPLQDAVNYPEHEAIKQLEEDRKKKNQDPVSQNCVVFSSLALLRMLCDVANPSIMGEASANAKPEDLINKLVVASDASHDFTHAGYKLVSLGIVNYSRVLSAKSTSYKKSYNPLVLMLCPSECAESYLVLFCAAKYAVFKLFGIASLNPAVLLQDCSLSLLNAVNISFPFTKTGTCWSHVIRKLITGRKGNGGYAMHLRRHGISFMRGTAANDVTLIHRCRTMAQAKKMATIVIDGWMKAGETKLAQVFSESYIQKEPFNFWWYSCLGIKGQSPHTNHLERIHLEAKGCSLWEGMVKTNVSIEQCLYREMPKLVYGWSRDRTGLQFGFKILDKEHVLGETSACRDLFEYSSKLDWENEVYEEIPADERKKSLFYFCTTVGSNNANASTVAARKSAMEGNFEGGYNKRETFIARTECLCCVEYQQTPTGEWCWMGDCVHFWKTTFCVHAACKQYEGPVRDLSFRLPTTKRKNKSLKPSERRKNGGNAGGSKKKTAGRTSRQSESHELLEQNKRQRNGTSEQPTFSHNADVQQRQQMLNVQQQQSTLHQHQIALNQAMAAQQQRRVAMRQHAMGLLPFQQQQLVVARQAQVQQESVVA